MGVFYEAIPASLIPWILEQRVIYIASAPLSASGHVNVSPKGGAYFGITSPTTFWYQDLTGSGVETLSHLYEEDNGRITVMLNAFEGAPKIVRLFGKGVVLEYGTEEFNSFVSDNSITTIAGTRAIIRVDIHQVGSSCGFSVPFYDFVGFRPTLNEFFEKKVENEKAGRTKDGLEMYWAHKNAESMDGLPGMIRGVETAKREGVQPIKKMVGKQASRKDQETTEVIQRRDVSMAKVAMTSFVLGMILAVFLLEYAKGELGPQGEKLQRMLNGL